MIKEIKEAILKGMEELDRRNEEKAKLKANEKRTYDEEYHNERMRLIGKKARKDAKKSFEKKSFWDGFKGMGNIESPHDSLENMMNGDSLIFGKGGENMEINNTIPVRKKVKKLIGQEYIPSKEY